MSTHIRKRRTATGHSYQVRYRRGGRAFPIEIAGSFTSQKEAKIRRDLVAGWLAAGLDPKAELAKIGNRKPPRLLRHVARDYEASRIDLAEGSRRGIHSHLLKILPVFGDRDPAAISVPEVQTFIGSLELTPASIGNYMQTLRMLLDFAEVDPNPARHRSVKLPRVEKSEAVPPPAAHVLAMLRFTPPRMRLPIIALEQTAMRVSELESLRWGDVDAQGSRFRISAGATKTRKARWVQVPEWLMGAIEDTRAREDRVASAKVFPAFTDGRARGAMERACVAAGLPHYHPHDLRHRRLSLWHGQGIPAAELAARAGHSRPTMTLDTYSHVMVDEEIGTEQYEAVVGR